MKYQVLARKYRPKTFSTMMGQEHVLKALSNALESERLHHAYLFTGTRGVGKTTVARVLAKALNCEQGISASPCGECPSCQEIDQGRFIDLIEVDAASRTKVEDTRELLDNVQYAPTRGRFKIYLIDEVHMLSTHSFNALLKTLEEPPPHVKFLLATTDPQKLPVTILSRCLQFNLKSLTIEQIEKQLDLVLTAETIPFENNVLKPLAIAADGSMRDALSLLDQSIAYSDGKPNLADIEAMLGSVQKDRVFELLTALAQEDGRTLIEQSRLLTVQGIDVNTILSELISSLQRIALCQIVPDAIDDSIGDKSAVERLAKLISPEDIQLYYQIALNGRKDLPYSPQPQGGFEMILLRMLAFKPVSGGSKQSKKIVSGSSVSQAQNASSQKVAAPVVQPQSVLQNEKQTAINTLSAEENKVQSTAHIPEAPIPETPLPAEQRKTGLNPPESDNRNDDLPPIDAYGAENFNESPVQASYDNDTPAKPQTVSGFQQQKNSSQGIGTHSNINHSTAAQTLVTEPLSPQLERPSLAEVVPLFKPDVQEHEQKQEKIPCDKPDANGLADYWHDLINQSELNGLEQQLAKHSALINKVEQNGEQLFELLLDSVHRHLLNDKIKTRLIDTLQKLFDCPVKLDIKECQVRLEEQLNTPRRREIHEAKVLQEEAVESIHSDPKVQMIVNAFTAKVRDDSIKPI